MVADRSSFTQPAALPLRWAKRQAATIIIRSASISSGVGTVDWYCPESFALSVNGLLWLSDHGAALLEKLHVEMAHPGPPPG